MVQTRKEEFIGNACNIETVATVVTRSLTTAMPCVRKGTMEYQHYIIADPETDGEEFWKYQRRRHLTASEIFKFLPEDIDLLMQDWRSHINLASLL